MAVEEIRNLEPPTYEERHGKEPEVVCHYHNEENQHKGTGKAENHIEAATKALEAKPVVPLTKKTITKGTIGCGKTEEEAHRNASHFHEN